MLPGESNAGVNDFDDSEDDEVDEGNLVMKGGGVDGGVSSPSEDGEVDPESLDASDTSDGVRGMMERGPTAGGDGQESDKTLAMLRGASTVDSVGFDDRCVDGTGEDVETRLVGRPASFLLCIVDDRFRIGGL